MPRQFHSEQAAMSDTDRPAMAKVLLLNDDETTMEFVVQVLEDVFEKTRYQALNSCSRSTAVEAANAESTRSNRRQTSLRA
jgi:hypothetical protein